MFGLPGWMEILILCMVGVLIFGKRLPEVGRNLGKGIIEFKKGLSGIETDINQAGTKNEAPRQLDRQSPPASPVASPPEKSTAGDRSNDA